MHHRHSEVGPTTMQQENYVSTVKITAIALWATAFALMGAGAVIVAVIDHQNSTKGRRKCPSWPR